MMWEPLKQYIAQADARLEIRRGARIRLREGGVKHHGLAIVALALGIGLACAEELTEPPDELVDTWHTDAPQMAGRYLEIRADWVVFGSGPYLQEMYPIERVEDEQRADGVHYTLYYEGKGRRERQLGVLYREGNPRSLQLDNRDERWVRTRDATWLEEKETT